MSYNKRFIISTAWVGSARIFANIISYFLIILISRFLGPDGMGQYAFALSFAAFFFLFSDIGTKTVMIKDLSKDYSKANKYISHVSFFRISLELLFLLIFIVTVLIMYSEAYMRLLLFVAGLFWFFRHLDLLSIAVLRIKSKGKYMAFSIFAEKTVLLVIGALVLFYFKDVLIYALVLTGSMLVKLLIDFVISLKYFKFEFSFDFSFMKKLIITGYPFFFIGVFDFIYSYIDRIMLFLMKGDTLTGLYTAAYNLIDVLNFIPLLIFTFGFPTLSSLYKKNKGQFSMFLSSFFRYSLMLILPILAGTLILAERIISFIYSDAFVDSAIVLRILIFAELFLLFNMILGLGLSSSDKQKAFMITGFVGAFVNIVLNVVLIHYFSYIGASISTLITFIIMFIMLSGYMKQHRVKVKYFSIIRKPFFASLFMIPVVFLLMKAHILLIIPVSAVFYFVILYMFGLHNEDKRLLNGALKFLREKIGF